MQSADIIVAAYDEWTGPLATELDVVDADENCPEGWAPFFTKEWKGSAKGCDYEDKIYDFDAYQTKRRQGKQGQGCDKEIPSLAAVSQTVFGGAKICGLFNGPKVKDLVTALDDGSCPSGLYNCQPYTINYQDTVCVEDLDECPIVAVEFSQS